MSEDLFVVKTFVDPNRSAKITLVFYKTGFLSFVVLPDGFTVGDKLKLKQSNSLNFITLTDNGGPVDFLSSQRLIVSNPL